MRNTRLIQKQKVLNFLFNLSIELPINSNAVSSTSKTMKRYIGASYKIPKTISRSKSK